MDENNNWFAWVAAGVSSVVAALTSAVAFLFKQNDKIRLERIVQLESEVCVLKDASERCQEEHANTKIELATFKERITHLEKKVG